MVKQTYKNQYVNLKDAYKSLGLNSGTDALMMSLWSSGIKRGDEVITSPMMFVATANSMNIPEPLLDRMEDDLNIQS